MSKNKLEKILNQMPSANKDLDAEDLKEMITAFILDQPDDEVEKSRGTRSRLKLDALRLLHDILKSENSDGLESAILSVIGKSND
jgi:hypothetical protein